MMKMRNLLLGFILGLLTAVHSTPVNTETSLPPKAEDDVLEEAMTDGFLVEQSFVPLVTTESSQKNTTIQATVQPSLDSVTEGSAEVPSSTFSELGVGHSYTTSVSHTQSPAFTRDYMADESFPSLTTASAITEASLQTSSDLMIEGSGEIVFPDDIGNPTTTGLGVSHTESPVFMVNPESVSSTIQTFQAGFTSLAAPKEARSKIFSLKDLFNLPDEVSASISDFLNSFDLSSGSGSGDFETSSPVIVETTESTESTESTTVTTSLSFAEADTSEKMTKQVQAHKDSQAIVGAQPETKTEMHKGHNTPEWIIIVGFLVGLAALIMLCAAIATKDKWNAPKQPSENSAKTNSSNQKMELEMQTFLQKDEPKEEGKDSEYTVIPLDELPENYSTD